jgi:PIN domain nuclease of toxin-antitoxin system
VILLDTNALIWLDQSHRRARRLLREGRRLYLSPATVLELQFLHECGRIRLPGGSVQPLVDDERWTVDEPPSGAWFEHAVDLIWTRDPFDRLIAAHAQFRRWRLATGDEALARQLGPSVSLLL